MSAMASAASNFRPAPLTPRYALHPYQRQVLRDLLVALHAVLGLMDDIAYAVQVRAVTAAGTGPPATVTGTPRVSRLLPSIPGSPR